MRGAPPLLSQALTGREGRGWDRGRQADSDVSGKIHPELPSVQSQTHSVPKNSEHVRTCEDIHTHTHTRNCYSLLLLSLKSKVLTYGQTPGPETVEGEKERGRQQAENVGPAATHWWGRDAKQRRAE